LKLVRVRQVSQIVFLALFLFLLWGTEVHSGGVRLRYPVGIFLQADPLTALTNALSTRALYRGLLWSLVVLLPALFFGRFFCGWICPLGTLHHIFSSLRSERKRGKQLIESNRYKRWQRLKYLILIAGLAAALLGTGVLGLLDPIPMLVRSFTLSVFPAVNYAIERATGASVLSFKQPHFRQAFLVGLVFVFLLALNFRVTRFWCRALCPLGALLGAASRWSLLKLEKRGEHCGECNRCLLACQGGDDPIPGARWRKAECHLCLNCVDACPDAGLAFRIGAAQEGRDLAEGPELGRRRMVASIAAGAAVIPLLRIGAEAHEDHERLVRPPGAAAEPDFLARCTRCGECMRVCPANALHPALLAAGVEALWTPAVVPRIGYCQPSCVLCGEACPTGAIGRFTPSEKGWRGEKAGAEQPIRIGTAFYDRGRCLPWAMATECIVCEEWCPTSPKAIYLREAEVPGAGGTTVRLRQPYIAAERCVGCGACEYACPVKDRPAVYVTSIGESRSRANQLLLRREGGSAVTAALSLPDSNEARGWTRTAPVRSFTPDNLWQYLDGGADRFVEAGLEHTLTAPYRFEGQLEAVADLHAFRTPAGAVRLFDAEPPGRAVPLGDAARLSASTLVFRKGPYLVRLVAYDDTPRTASALIVLARAIEARLPR